MEAEEQGLPPAVPDAHPPHPPRTFSRRIDCAPKLRPAAPAGEGVGTAAHTPQEGA